MTARVTALLTCGVLFALASPIASAAPPRVEATVLNGTAAKRQVVDTMLSPTSARARTSAAPQTQEWVDDHGHTITISTDLPAVDLTPFAGILAGTLHGDEIEDLRVVAGTMSHVGSICGNPAAVACYTADDADSSTEGQMWFAVDDPDVTHTIVHEYGHHTDNQLVNLAHFGGACGYDNDGSRAWFIARELEDDIIQGGANCLPDSSWEYLLGELYAEDFVTLNGIVAWQLRSFRSPTVSQLEALDYDLSVPFEPASRAWRPYVRYRRVRYTTITLTHWTFLTVTLRSPHGRDFDLGLYRPGKARALARSQRGRFDRVKRLLRPGRYDVVVYAYRGSGRARVAIAME